MRFVDLDRNDRRARIEDPFFRVCQFGRMFGVWMGWIGSRIDGVWLEMFDGSLRLCRVGLFLVWFVRLEFVG